MVRLGSTILVAPGSRLRQLRPDQESAEGWVRAVLRGKARGLGAIIASPREAALALRGATILTTCNGTASRPGPASLKHPLSIIHSTGTGRCWLHAPCGPSCRAALANIVVDRLLAGLPP
ncbi:MAG: hypothetical protein F7C34_02715 [Desulfurococcales archaeon]|nr:hypothetical protein [Desulfurococcales archaeon]